MAFTGIRDVDLEILSKLDDSELGKMCSTDKYFRNLCKNDDFWRNRTIKRFGRYLGTVEEINDFRKKVNIPTWRLYYISLVDFIYNTLYSEKQFANNGWRKDFYILNKDISENNENFINEISDNFKEGKWKKILGEDLINPNKFLDIFELYGDDRKEFVDYLLSLKDKRININNALSDLLYLSGEEDEQIVKKFLNDPRISVEKIIDVVVNHSMNSPERYGYDEGLLKSFKMYLDLIKEKNGIVRLQEKIAEDEYINPEMLSYIYEYLGIHGNHLSQIYDILKNKKMGDSDYIRILKFIKKL